MMTAMPLQVSGPLDRSAALWRYLLHALRGLPPDLGRIAVRRKPELLSFAVNCLMRNLLFLLTEGSRQNGVAPGLGLKVNLPCHNGAVRDEALTPPLDLVFSVICDPGGARLEGK
jgi:hypothetical protein